MGDPPPNAPRVPPEPPAPAPLPHTATLDDVVRALNRLGDAMLKLVNAQTVAMDKPGALPPTPPSQAVAPHRRNS